MLDFSCITYVASFVVTSVSGDVSEFLVKLEFLKF